jgi:TonB family protein
LLHLGLSVVVIIVFSAFPDVSENLTAHTVELIRGDEEPVVGEVTVREEPVAPQRARLGSPTVPLHGALGDRPLLRAEDHGTAAGEGEAASHSRITAGNDTRDLRVDPYTHPSLDLTSREVNRTKVVTRDNLNELLDSEPTPFMASTGQTRTRRTPSPSPQAPSGGQVRSPRSRQALPLERSKPDLQQHDSRGPGDEVMSKLPKDGALAVSVDPQQQRLAPGKKSDHPRSARARPTRRDQASNRLLPDVLDAARPRGTGSARLGGGRGSVPGRRGDVRGSVRGQLLWLTSGDRRYVDYFRKIYRKVNPLWLFPKKLEILMEQGDVLVQFTILSNGQVRNVKIRKSSGYPEFDHNVLVAIRKAAPFGPIPEGLGKQLRILAPFEFSNPMVQ